MATQKKQLTSFKALAANSAETNVKKNDLYKVPPHMLNEEEGFNERDYDDPEVEAHIEGFAQAYAAGNYVPPPIVRIDSITGIIYIVEGHCRRRGALRAIARGAPIAHLDCLPFRGNDEDRVHLMVSSADGLKLKPLGLANSFLRLMRMGKTSAEIAKRHNRTVSNIDALLTLAMANSDVHALVRSGAASASVAIEAVRMHGDKAGEFLARILEGEKAKGKKSVKPSALKDWAPPRKMATAIYANLEPVYESLVLQDGMLELLDNQDGVDLEGKKFWVDAKEILALCKAFQHAKALNKKQSMSKSAIEEGDGAAIVDVNIK